MARDRLRLKFNSRFGSIVEKCTSTTVSETLGDGMTENVATILSGNSCNITMRGQRVDSD